ncbi:MAG: PBP1A family penicillin-binding protein, partial [Myxococcales bacterium]|nr:PBP1A family penicillin-binding protein [Myxococcales bacterium]
MNRKKASKASRPRKKNSPVRWLRWLGALAVLGVIGALVGVAMLAFVARDLPTVEELKRYRPPETTRIVDRNGALLGEVFAERRTVVPIERIPRVMILSVLAAEDADFYQHQGLDYPGIVRAVLRDVVEGRAAQGASTITQQVVKLLLLSPERTLSRKIKELVLARRLEQTLTKDEILFLYLNQINFGHGRYGVEEASRFYFDKHVEALTLAEASLLAGIPQSPTQLSPRRNLDAAKRRQKLILGQLAAKRATHWPDLRAEEIEAAKDGKIEIVPLPESEETAPEIFMLARKMLRDIVGEEAFRRGGYTVKTSVDLRLQAAARASVVRNLVDLDARHGYRFPLSHPKGGKTSASAGKPSPKPVDLKLGPTYTAHVVSADDATNTLTLDIEGAKAALALKDAVRFNPKELKASEAAKPGDTLRVSIAALGENGDAAVAHAELGPEAAAVVIDPRTRDVLALVGGYEATTGFNRAVQATRQPGSTFKPIVYALGIKSRRFTPATTVLDAPAVYDQWQPKNFETWNHAGAIRLRDAVAQSINLVAVRVIEELSPVAVVDFAKKLGITTPLDPSLPLALGASDVHPVELTNAYATFAAGGRWAPVRLVLEIRDRNGQVVKLPASEPPRVVMSEAEAYVVTSILESVVKGGTGAAAQKLGRPAAGKTGTSNQARDAWFMGYTPNVVAGVWVGFDDRRSLGRRESGGRAAVPIWTEVVAAAEDKAPALAFPVPSGVVTARIDPKSGLLAYDGMPDAIDEVFLEGTVPTETARSPDRVDART